MDIAARFLSNCDTVICPCIFLNTLPVKFLLVPELPPVSNKAVISMHCSIVIAGSVYYMYITLFSVPFISW